MKTFKAWVETTGGEIQKGMEGFGAGLAFMKYKRAAMLYIAARPDEARLLLAQLSPENQKVVWDLFVRSFPKPNPQLSTSQINSDPQFNSWVDNKLTPLIDSFSQAPQTFSISKYLENLGIRPDWVEVTKSKTGDYVFIRNRKSGQTLNIAVNEPTQIVQQKIKAFFGIV
jgi:hypothetical protein